MVDYAAITVQDFAKWWLQNKPFNTPVESPIRFIAGFTGVTVFREGPFQVQLFTALPNTDAPRHTHPNVDSMEVFICGDIDFSSERDERSGFGPGTTVHVEPSEPHGAKVGAQGVCFFSVQKWIGAKPPSSVELDWTGAPLDGQHAQELTAMDEAVHAQIH